jgi:hypothetical protein
MNLASARHYLDKARIPYSEVYVNHDGTIQAEAYGKADKNKSRLLAIVPERVTVSTRPAFSDDATPRSYIVFDDYDYVACLVAAGWITE